MAMRVAKRPLGFLEEAGKMFGVGLEALHTVGRRPWPVEEFISQIWFLAGTSRTARAMAGARPSCTADNG